MELKETIKNRRSIRKYKNTEISKEIIEDLPKVMEKYGIDNLEDIIGKAHLS